MQEESKRQLQVGQLINEELSTIFTKLNLTIVHSALVSIYKVKVSPDLLEANIYLSIYNTDKKESVLNIFKQRASEIRGMLGNELRHQLRRIPRLNFFIDDTLDYVFKMEEIFKEINKDKKEEDK